MSRLNCSEREEEVGEVRAAWFSSFGDGGIVKQIVKYIWKHNRIRIVKTILEMNKSVDFPGYGNLQLRYCGVWTKIGK